jgi:4'-phosphopantetheinyl transferase EntD
MIPPARVRRIEAAVSALFPQDVAVALCSLSAADPSDLWPEERAAVAGAVPHRQAEFAAGRQAARSALAALGHAPVALPMGPDRAPIWPAGIAGSISHASGLAVAVVRQGAPLGIDIEDDAPLPEDLWPTLTSPEERAAFPPGDIGRQVRRVFAAKEALFKAQAQGARAMFGFDAVRVTLAETGFDAQILWTAGAFRIGETVRGRLALVEGLVLAGVAR